MLQPQALARLASPSAPSTSSTQKPELAPVGIADVAIGIGPVAADGCGVGGRGMEAARDCRRLAARHAGKHRQPAGGVIERRGEQVAHDDLGRIGICPAKKFSSSGSVTRIMLPGSAHTDPDAVAAQGADQFGEIANLDRGLGLALDIGGKAILTAVSALRCSPSAFQRRLTMGVLACGSATAAKRARAFAQAWRG